MKQNANLRSMDSDNFALHKSPYLLESSDELAFI